MDTLLYVGLGNAVLAAVLAVAAAAVSRLCRGRPALAHSLWLLVLLKLLTPPLLPLPVPWPDRAAAPAVDGTSSAPTADAAPDALVDVAAAPARLDGPPAAADVPAAPPPDPPHSLFPAEILWKPALLTVWLGGALLWWGAVGLRLARFRRSWCCARPAPTEVQERAAQLARRLGLTRCPGVWFLPAPVGPLLWAVAGPARVLLPAGLWQTLSAAQRDTLLAHELAHLRRGDPWVRRLELLALGLYWWHPVAWWARRRLQEAEEECCDAWVVWALPEAADAYAEALLCTVRFLSQSRAALPAGASGAGQVRLLKRRLTMIVQGTTPRGLSRAGLVAVLALAAALLPLLPTRGQAPPPADDTAPQRAAPPVAPAPAAPATPAARPAAPDVPASSARRFRGADTAPEARALAPDPEGAREEVELLRIQLQGKQAELQESKALMDQAKRHLARVQELSGRGAVDVGVVDQAQTDLEVQRARLSGKEAQLREAELRLRQAERRLGRTQPHAGRPDALPGPPRSPANREAPRPGAAPSRGISAPEDGRGREAQFRDLEKKVDALLREVEQLRREMRGRPPAGPDGRLTPPAFERGAPPSPPPAGDARRPPAPGPTPAPGENPPPPRRPDPSR